MLILAAGSYGNNLLEHLTKSRILAAIDGRLWDQRDRWNSIGCSALDFASLRAMHKPDVGVDMDSDEYGQWWHAAKQELERRIRDGLSD